MIKLYKDKEYPKAHAMGNLSMFTGYICLIISILIINTPIISWTAVLGIIVLFYFHIKQDYEIILNMNKKIRRGDEK